jgi:hypothetical protein
MYRQIIFLTVAAFALVAAVAIGYYSAAWIMGGNCPEP